jgi:hypothetical protein
LTRGSAEGAIPLCQGFGEYPKPINPPRLGDARGLKIEIANGLDEYTNIGLIESVFIL